MNKMPYAFFENTKIPYNDSVWKILKKLRDYDLDTFEHSLYVSVIAHSIACQIGCDSNFCNDVAICGLIHDIGKLDVPISIIHKNGPLTGLEYEIIKTHSLQGYMRAQSLDLPQHIKMVTLHHHEKLNGTGYPCASMASEISTYSKLTSIADVFCALVENRTYRHGYSIEYAINFIIMHPEQFDLNLFPLSFDVKNIFSHT